MSHISIVKFLHCIIIILLLKYIFVIIFTNSYNVTGHKNVEFFFQNKHPVLAYGKVTPVSDSQQEY
jgi:ABC-type phosphate transport system permease subunit